MYRNQNNFAAQQQADRYVQKGRCSATRLTTTIIPFSHSSPHPLPPQPLFCLSLPLPLSLSPSSFIGEHYDPNDKNADWAGFVPKPSGRQHQFAHGKTAHSQSLTADSTYNGLVPTDSANTSDWQKPGKKVYVQQQSQFHPASYNNDGSTYRSKSFELFGGPDPISAVSGSRHFSTEARSNFVHPEATMQGYGGGTAIEQLTSKARSLYVPGKKSVEPMFLQPNGGLPQGMTQRQYLDAMRRENPYDLHGGYQQQGGGYDDGGAQDGSGVINGDPDRLIGFRHNPRVLGGSMMTDGLGAELLSAGLKPPKKPEHLLPRNDGKAGGEFKENGGGANSIPGLGSYAGKRR